MSPNFSEILENTRLYWTMGAALPLGIIVLVISLYFYLGTALTLARGTRVRGQVHKKYVTAESRHTKSYGITISFKADNERFVKPFKVPYAYYRQRRMHEQMTLAYSPKNPRGSAVLVDLGNNPVPVFLSLFTTAMAGGYFYCRKRVLGTYV